MPWIDGRDRLLSQGERPRRRDDLLEIIAASVLHRIPATHPDVAIEVAELVLAAFSRNSLRIIWRPRTPEWRSYYVPPKRGKHAPRPLNRPLPRMGESIADAEARTKREAERRSEPPSEPIE